MTRDEQAINEIGRRLAAAYVSYIAGHKRVDRMLARTPRKVSKFWKELARLLFEGVKNQSSMGDLKLRKAITKYIQ